MAANDRFESAGRTAGSALGEVKNAIDRLEREDRAALRPWLLARYDVRGYACASTFAAPPETGGGEPPVSAR